MTAASSPPNWRSDECREQNPSRFVGFIRDITVRRNAEEALRRSEAQLTIAQEIANLGNYVVHFDGKFEDYWSPHLYRVLGRRYGERYIGVYEYLEPMVHLLIARAGSRCAMSWTRAHVCGHRVSHHSSRWLDALRASHGADDTQRRTASACVRSARCTTLLIGAAQKMKRGRCRIASRTSAASRRWARWRPASRTRSISH